MLENITQCCYWSTGQWISRTLSTLFNTSAADYEYSSSYGESLPLLIQMQLSHKTKEFCRNFIAFLESELSFEHFTKKKRKNEPHNLSIPEIL